MKPSSQPCWNCTKACGKCCWSKNFEPIPNWRAKKHIVDKIVCDGITYITESYTISFCPEFVDERIEFIKEHINFRPYQIAESLHIGLKTAKRLLEYTKKELKTKNEKSI
jgi:hypothetical protein